MTSRSRLIAIIAGIAVPLITFSGGMYVQHLISERSLRFQEFSTASGLLASEAAKHSAELRAWVEVTIRQYTKIQSQLPASADYYLVSKEIADNVCLIPVELFDRIKRVADRQTANATRRTSDDMDAEYRRALEGWLTTAAFYERVVRSFRDDCGFLKRAKQ